MRDLEDRRRAFRYGNWGERTAAWLLRLKGYHILAHRFSCQAGEVDLVAHRRGVLCFVEVKARSDLLTAADAITPRQRQRIVRAASVFVQKSPALQEMGVRFDAVLVSPWKLPCHVPDAWRP